jgi:hypothetical protein
MCPDCNIEPLKQNPKGKIISKRCVKCSILHAKKIKKKPKDKYNHICENCSQSFEAILELQKFCTKACRRQHEIYILNTKASRKYKPIDVSFTFYN